MSNKSVMPELTKNLYDSDYFERGVMLGISGYTNYSWMPELTMRMAHHIIQQLPIERNQRVLDFGCAKGYLVHALRLLDIDAYGVDVSDYALSELPREVGKYCYKVDRETDIASLGKEFDWLISKDVFEHLTEQELRELFNVAKNCVDKMFVAVPLGREDGKGFIIPQYDQDITHVTVKPADWWRSLFEKEGYVVESETRAFRGVKENWVKAHPDGNAFFILKRKSA